jgi:hypothetical protein
MDEQPSHRPVVFRDEAASFRSHLRFVQDSRREALDAADAAPWTKPGDLAGPSATAVDAIPCRLTHVTARIGHLTCASRSTALGWDDLGGGRTRCVAQHIPGDAPYQGYVV